MSPIFGRVHPRAVGTGGDQGEIIEAYRRQAGRTVDRLFRSMPDPGSRPVFALEHPTAEHMTGEPGLKRADRSAWSRVPRATAKPALFQAELCGDVR